MANEFKHLVLVKFKEDVVVEDIIKGLEKLVQGMDIVKSFVWGKDVESSEMLTQGYTHAIIMTFNSKEEYKTFANQPHHVEFGATFASVIDKAVLLDFPAISVKAPT
ncbi:stress-response A/B barrel domain-containing protein At5g22580 [Solanum dulcamara]|uniref:stress-response A/B barrel domain-containing protein At5g22580 n=1 Tax=Solanum dulcamara TaxID=45834 RepID=UPI002485AFB4|nr:stress-response A/B barrel domain-containing protein At5g22580 [Solanum dulcamara]